MQFALLPPKIIREELIKSSLAALSVRNSGLKTILSFGYSLMRRSTVPGTTVDFKIKIGFEEPLVLLIFSKTDSKMLRSIFPPNPPDRDWETSH